MANQIVARGGIHSSGSIFVTGSVTSSLGFFGTASFANATVSSSFAPSSISSSFAIRSISSSFADRSISSSHALNANSSNTALSSTSSSFGTRSISSSHALASNTSLTSNSATSSSFGTRSISASHALASNTTITASYALASAGTGLSGGTVNYIPMWTSATAQSSSVLYQSSSNIGIGVISPLARFHVQGTSHMSGSVTIQVPTSPTLTIQGAGGTGSVTVGSDFRVGALSNISLSFIQNSAVAWYIDTNKFLLPNVNNSYDIGSNSFRARTIWATNISSSNPIPTASFATRTISSSHALNANSSNTALSATSSSFATSASWAPPVPSVSSSFADRSISSSHALNANNAITASFASIVSTVFAQTASYFSGSIKVEGLAEFPAGITVTGSSVLSGSVTSFGGLALSGSSYFKHTSGSVVAFMKANPSDNSVRFGAETFNVVNIDISGFTRYQYGQTAFLPTDTNINLGSTSNKWQTLHAGTISASLMFGTASNAVSASWAPGGSESSVSGDSDQIILAVQLFS